MQRNALKFDRRKIKKPRTDRGKLKVNSFRNAITIFKKFNRFGFNLLLSEKSTCNYLKQNGVETMNFELLG